MTITAGSGPTGPGGPTHPGPGHPPTTPPPPIDGSLTEVIAAAERLGSELLALLDSAEPAATAARIALGLAACHVDDALVALGRIGSPVQDGSARGADFRLPRDVRGALPLGVGPVYDALPRRS